jgi:hypothetical protein
MDAHSDYIRAHFLAELSSPVFWAAVLLPVLLTLPVAWILARRWRELVSFRWPEFLLAPVPTAAWNFVSLVPGLWHPGKGWGNLLELPALGMLSVVYVFVRRFGFRGVLPFWGYMVALLLGAAAGYASLRFVPTAPFLDG